MTYERDSSRPNGTAVAAEALPLVAPVHRSKQRTATNHRLLAVCGFLLLAVGLVFGQTIGHEFVNFDDDVYVYENPQVTKGLTIRGIAAAFADHPYYHWQPLSLLSHMLDCQLYGLNPGGHHLTSVLLHAAAAICLFLVLLRMIGDFWPSAFVAAVFAVHPLRAESVVWVSERKDVLSGLFFMLTVGAYVGYVRRRSWLRYLLVLALFGLGLMAKAMIVTLPVVLLLLDYWPLRRLEARGLRLEETGRMSLGLRSPASSLTSRTFGLLVEKIPLALLAGTVCVVTLITQSSGIQTNDHFPIGARVGNAIVAYVAYMGKFFYPVALAAYYPHPADSLSPWMVAAASLILLGITVGAVLGRTKYPYALVGWLWYLVMLLPVSQLVQLGEYSMADRYTYLPQIGLAIALAWGAADLSRSWLHPMTGRSARPTNWITGAAAALVIACLMGCAWRQASYWRDSKTLWSQSLAVNPRNPLAHNNYAGVLMEQGKIDEAVRHYRDALEIQPDSVKAHSNLAVALARQGQMAEAVEHLRTALQIKPDHGPAHTNLANALMAQGNYGEAVSHFRSALALSPDLAMAHFNLACGLAAEGKVDEAIAHYQQVLAIDSDSAAAHFGLANAFAQQGDIDKAIASYEKALEIQPLHADTHTNLANALAAQGNNAAAISHYRQALEIQPLSANAHFYLGRALYSQGDAREAVSHWREAARLAPNQTLVLKQLSWVLATHPDESIRNGPKAVELADRAIQLSGNSDPALIDSLAAAYAETGRFSQAVQTATQAMALADRQNNRALAAAIRQRINRYRAGIPYRETGVTK